MSSRRKRTHLQRAQEARRRAECMARFSNSYTTHGLELVRKWLEDRERGVPLDTDVQRLILRVETLRGALKTAVGFLYEHHENAIAEILLDAVGDMETAARGDLFALNLATLRHWLYTPEAEAEFAASGEDIEAARRETDAEIAARGERAPIREGATT